MKPHPFSFPHSFYRFSLALILIFAVAILSATSVAAQSDSPEIVDAILGKIFGSEDTKTYTLENLAQGDTVYVHVQGISGNLDPFVALLSSDQLAETKAGKFDEEVQQAIANNRDPLLVVKEFSNAHFLAWDDDSGSGFSAAFEFTIPQDGDYHLIVISSPFTDTV